MRLRFNQASFYIRLELNFISLFWSEFQAEMRAHTNRTFTEFMRCPLNVSSFTLLFPFMFLASKAFPCLHSCCSKTYALGENPAEQFYLPWRLFRALQFWINLSFSAIPIVSIMFNFCSCLWNIRLPHRPKMPVFSSISSAACNTALCTQYIYLLTTTFSGCFNL